MNMPTPATEAIATSAIEGCSRVTLKLDPNSLSDAMAQLEELCSTRSESEDRIDYWGTTDTLTAKGKWWVTLQEATP